MNDKKLTVAEATEQGYTMYGFESKEWQTTEDLHDEIFKEIKEDDWEDVVLFEKEPSQPTINATQIADLLAERISDDDAQECGREDDAVYNTIKAIDFNDLADEINAKLKQHEYWMLTNIKLVQ